MTDRLSSRHEQELRDLDPAEHPDIAALLSKIDGQRRVIRNQTAKIDRQRVQLHKASEDGAVRNRTVAEQDRLIAEQSDEIQQLREQLANLHESSEGNG